MHAIEKIFAKNAGVREVRAGDTIWAIVDLALGVDLYRTVLTYFDEIGAKTVAHPERCGYIFGINAPAPTIKAAENEKAFREFCKKHGIKNLFDINSGVVYQVVMEKGLILPGSISIAGDSHATIIGALGAVGTGMGSIDTAAAMAFGEMWFKVPEVLKIELNGNLKKGVYAKDVVLKLLRELKSDIGIYKCVEYTGEIVKNMSLSERMVLTNMAVELGFKTSYIQPDEKVIEFMEGRTDKTYDIFETDDNYEYSEVYTFDFSDLEPQIAIPPSPDNVVNISDMEAIKLDQALIGTCTGGRYEDIEIAANILKGKKVHSDCRTLIIPGSYEIYLKAMEAGHIKTLIEAGCVICNASCGPCLGAHMGILAPGETCITAANRNFAGRMGSEEAEIYLASPAAVAASAIEGKLVDPRNYL